MPTFQINTNFALAGRNDAQEADAQVPHQALRVQNARRTVRETRPVRARQDGERGGGDGEKKIYGMRILQIIQFRHYDLRYSLFRSEHVQQLVVAAGDHYGTVIG